jgi:hypothetical protein
MVAARNALTREAICAERKKGAGKIPFACGCPYCRPRTCFPGAWIEIALLTNRRSAALEVSIAHGAVKVHGAFGNALEAVKIQ